MDLYRGNSTGLALLRKNSSFKLLCLARDQKVRGVQVCISLGRTGSMMESVTCSNRWGTLQTDIAKRNPCGCGQRNLRMRRIFSKDPRVRIFAVYIRRQSVAVFFSHSITHSTKRKIALRSKACLTCRSLASWTCQRFTRPFPWPLTVCVVLCGVPSVVMP